MKRKVFAFLLCFVLVMAMPITARADMGPKPSVRIEFTGIQGETYYGTLLSFEIPPALLLHGKGIPNMPGLIPEMRTMISG